MADTKITALTALTAADPANDVIPIVDVSDTSMAASGTTKKISVNNILGASGTATLASAAITGDLTVDTSTLKVDSTNNRVGIGTATPGETLDVKGTGNFNNTSGTYLGFQTNAAQVGYIGTANTIITGGLNTELGLWANSSLVIASGASALQRLRVEAAGDVTISTGNVVMATSGKGIDFAATASGSGTMTSELLNDYEEGTFTPTVFGSTGAGVGVYSAQGGFYTKVGNIVTVQVYLIWSALAGGTGDLRFGGLPFAASASANAISAASIGYANNITLTASNVLTIFNSGTNTFVQAYQYPVGGGASTIVPVALSGGIIYRITYRV